MVFEHLRRSPLEMVPFLAEDAALVAALAPNTHTGAVLGDRACLALAAARGIPALTADSAWLSLDVGVRVHLVR